MAESAGSPLTTPKTVDPNEYFKVSPAERRSEVERAALRANLKRQYQQQLNNPLRRDLVDDPAFNRWLYARTRNYPNFKPTAKSSLMAVTFGVMPLFLFYYMFKSSRDKKEAQIKDGTYGRKFGLSR